MCVGKRERERERNKECVLAFKRERNRETENFFHRTKGGNV